MKWVNTTSLAHRRVQASSRFDFLKVSQQRRLSKQKQTISFTAEVIVKTKANYKMIFGFHIIKIFSSRQPDKIKMCCYS